MTGPEGAPHDTPAALPNFTVHAIHLVRTTTQVNLALSQMADQKASILMGATFVVFTIAVGQAGKGNFPIALMVLAISAFLSAMFAVAAILPSIRPPAASSDDDNILFFGVFTQLDEDDFARQVLSRLGSDEQVFRTMLRDIYQNGQVLQRKKYRYLGLAYRIFLAGLTVTLIMFLIESRELLFAAF
jgi:hypothetical protein